jgi:signal peptidase
VSDTALLPAPVVEEDVVVPGLVTRATLREATRRDERPRRTWGALRKVTGWVVLAFAFIALWPAQFGGITGMTVVNGHSMEPTYVTGDLIVSVRQPHYEVGDIVSYQVPEGQAGAGGRVIHRISAVSAGVGGPRYATQGDNNPEADPWVISDGDILGQAVVRIPHAGVGLTGEGSTLALALALGFIVTLLLWGDDRGSRRDDETEQDDRS